MALNGDTLTENQVLILHSPFLEKKKRHSADHAATMLYISAVKDQGRIQQHTSNFKDSVRSPACGLTTEPLKLIAAVYLVSGRQTWVKWFQPWLPSRSWSVVGLLPRTLTPQGFKWAMRVENHCFGLTVQATMKSSLQSQMCSDPSLTF